VKNGSGQHRVEVLHILPEYGTGGAEVAALSAAFADHGQVRLLFLSGSGLLQPAARLRVCEGCHPMGIKAIRTAMRTVRQQRPQVVIVSLWKSLPVLLALRAMRLRPRLVHLLHADRPKHRIDQLAHAIMLRACDAVWADSSTTLDSRYPPNRRTKPTRVVSFLVRRIDAPTRSEPAARFIFWGRLARQKQVEQSIEIFARIAEHHASATFTIIGRDDGTRASAESRARELGVADRVVFTGELGFEEICKLAEEASFYLQTSTFEGMAMSVVEAMQLGLVPVVTPVGEIARYCRHLENAVVFRGLDQTAGDVRAALADPSLYRRLSAAAVNTWERAPLYREDIVAAASEIVSHPRGPRRNDPSPAHPEPGSRRPQAS
jgi:glycosyltransferase involved in cell wall biosynthesis